MLSAKQTPTVYISSAIRQVLRASSALSIPSITRSTINTISPPTNNLIEVSQY